MPIDIIYVATSDISSNTETEFTKLKVREIVKAVLHHIDFSGSKVDVTNLTVVEDTPDSAHEIQLASENSFKCYDAIKSGDILVLTVVLKGEYTGV